jgi:hypothetical protein
MVALVAVVIPTATGCATRPLFSPRTADLDDSGLEAAVSDAGGGPIRLVSFDVLPLWPGRDEVSETTSSVATPIAAGAEAVKRGAGQVRQGFVSFGQGARRAVTSTTNWLSRPLIAVCCRECSPPSRLTILPRRSGNFSNRSGSGNAVCDDDRDAAAPTTPPIGLLPFTSTYFAPEPS